MTGLRRYAVAAALVCIPGAVRADVDALENFLARLDAHRAKLVDFTATFRQRQYASLFDDTKLSSGVLKYRAPGEMLWEYREPDHSYLRVSKTEVQFYFPLLEQIEVYPIADQRSMSSLLASFNQPVADLRQDYRLEYRSPGTARAELATGTVEFPDAPGLTLIPQEPALQAQFTRIDLWVRPESFVPCLLTIAEPTGDTTTFVFDDIKTNTGLDDAALTFHAPPGTTVVRSAPAS